MALGARVGVLSSRAHGDPWAPHNREHNLQFALSHQCRVTADTYRALRLRLPPAVTIALCPPWVRRGSAVDCFACSTHESRDRDWLLLPHSIFDFCSCCLGFAFCLCWCCLFPTITHHVSSAAGLCVQSRGQGVGWRQGQGTLGARICSSLLGSQAASAMGLSQKSRHRRAKV